MTPACTLALRAGACAGAGAVLLTGAALALVELHSPAGAAVALLSMVLAGRLFWSQVAALQRLLGETGL